MSWMRYMTLKSFRFLNPTWDIILYTAPCSGSEKTWKDNVDQDFFTYKGQNFFDKVHELDIEILEWKMVELQNVGPSHLSNFLKWFKLQAHGGIYADMDILWVRPFDELYQQMREFDTAICWTKYLSIGLLGSSIGNRMFQKFYSHACSCYTPDRYQCVGVESIYALLYNDLAFSEDGSVDWNFLAQQNMLQDIRDRFPDLKIFNIPFATVYPFKCTEMEKVFNARYSLPDHVVGLHWYAGDPLAQEWNRVIHPGNMPLEDNTFTEVARRYA